MGGPIRGGVESRTQIRSYAQGRMPSGRSASWADSFSRKNQRSCDEREQDQRDHAPVGDGGYASGNHLYMDANAHVLDAAWRGAVARSLNVIVVSLRGRPLSLESSRPTEYDGRLRFDKWEMLREMVNGMSSRCAVADLCPRMDRLCAS